MAKTKAKTLMESGRIFFLPVERLCSNPAQPRRIFDQSALQELLQGQGLPSPEYQTLAEEGPAHLRIFTVAVYTQGQEAGRGSGNSKKRAEQAAAGEALKRLRAAEETK